ncbi:hypothetical protein GCK32_013420 [Trichostrongylus colubriformis]|uniref:Uncharacterized protein n=1 Tax=Trichostrongylus colubriformis TaxID=6319 RepID=A0AAN8IK05_TRICO
MYVSEERRSPSPTETPKLEWWEKKPSWQQRIEDDRVIPAVGGKPPRTPNRRASSRHSTANYDPAASVENHQSREGSRASHRSEERPTSTTGRADSRLSYHSGERSSSVPRRTPSRSSRRASRQDTQSSLHNDGQRAEETDAPADNLGGNVARDPRGRPLAFVIS